MKYRDEITFKNDIPYSIFFLIFLVSWLLPIPNIFIFFRNNKNLSEQKEIILIYFYLFYRQPYFILIHCKSTLSTLWS